MKPLELKLICALIKDSRRSDRELAKNLGVSQPTISRLRTKLEKDGLIREYTMLPDFRKIGFEIMAFTFYRLQKPLPPEQIEQIRTNILERARQNPTAVIIAMGGMGGLDADRVVVSFHKDFSDYTVFLRDIRQIPQVIVAEPRSFLVDLGADVHFYPLSFSRLADYVTRESEDYNKNLP